MYTKFIRNRITELRLAKGVSEYQMSIDLGHSKGYIQSISSGRALPSLSEFLYMFEYFEITPEQFFTKSNSNPILINKIVDQLENLNTDDLNAIYEIVKRISRN